ncbi:MAG: HAD-IIB family hydrolase [bacterium]
MTDFVDYIYGVDCLVTDLDNTLFLAGTDRLPPEFIPGIKKWRRAGGNWIIATGRPIHRLRDFFLNWRLWPDYCIAGERYIFHYPRPETEIPFRSWNRRLKKITDQVEADFHNLIKPNLKWANELNIAVERQEFSLRFQSESKAREAEKMLAEQIAENQRIVALRNRVHLSIAPSDAGKGVCINHLAVSRGWDPRGILCFGDSMNDRDMLDGRYGFRAAAVANAEAQLKKIVRENGGIVSKLSAGYAVVDCLEQLLKIS